MSAKISTHVQLNGIKCFYKPTSATKPNSLIVKGAHNKHLFDALSGILSLDVISLITEYAPRKMQMRLASFPLLRKQAEETFKKRNITMNWEAPVEWTFAALSINPRDVNAPHLHVKFQSGYTYYLFTHGTFPIECRAMQKHPAEPLEVSTSSFVVSDPPSDFLPWFQISLRSRPSVVQANAQVNGVPIGLHVDTWIVRCKGTQVIDSRLFTHARIPIPHPEINPQKYGEIRLIQNISGGANWSIPAIAKNAMEETAAAERALSQATSAELNAVIKSRMAQHAAALKVMSTLPVNLSKDVRQLGVMTVEKVRYLQ